jgi:hypothetical protein
VYTIRWCALTRSAQAVYLAKNERGALVEGQTVERLPDARRRFLAGQEPIRQRRAFRLHVAELLQMLVERHLAAAVTAPPPALPVARLIDHDPVNPGAKGRLPAETR